MYQIQRIHRSRFIISSKVIDNILEMTMMKAEHAWDKNEEQEFAYSRRVSLEGDINEIEETRDK